MDRHPQEKPLILIVEDTIANIKILVGSLKSAYDIGVATNGEDAISYLKDHTPDLVLLDILMPEMNGYEVCQIMKQDETTKNIPIIFISALHEVSDKSRGFKMGAVDYITKPFEVPEVMARIKTHIELKRTREVLEKKNRQLDQLSSKLSKYLPSQIYASIFAGKREVKQESHRKKLTVFFSDIVEFTKLTDSLESETLTYLLNDYLNEMAAISAKNGGTLNKFIGDAILIFFGDPETRGEKEDAIACINMALEMKDRMEVLREKWRSQGYERPPHIRMGITTGYCTVGNFGSEDRLEYTIIGRQVNLASRLESHAGTDEIWVSHPTYSLVKQEVVCGKEDKIKVKGMAYPVQVYELIDLKDGAITRETRMIDKAENFLETLDPDQLDRESIDRLIGVLVHTMDRLNASSRST